MTEKTVIVKKTCDICGKEVKEFGYSLCESNSEIIATLRFDIWYVVSHNMDLCPDCNKALIKWIKEHSYNHILNGTTKDNKCPKD